MTRHRALALVTGVLLAASNAAVPEIKLSAKLVK